MSKGKNTNIISLADRKAKGEGYSISYSINDIYAELNHIGTVFQKSTNICGTLYECLKEAAEKINIPFSEFIIPEEAVYGMEVSLFQFQMEESDQLMELSALAKGTAAQYIIAAYADMTDEDEVEFSYQALRADSENRYMTYDFENSCWVPSDSPDGENMYEFTEKQKTEMEKSEWAYDFLMAIAETYGPVSDEDFKYLNQKWGSLLKLYRQTSKYMELEFSVKGEEAPDVRDDSVQLLLVPDDPFRHGFCVRWTPKGYSLCQYFTPWDFICDSDTDDELDGLYLEVEGKLPYIREISHTKDLNTIKKTLYHLANRYCGDDDTYTVPLSHGVYIETRSLNKLSSTSRTNVTRELTPEEAQNKGAMQKFIKKVIWMM